MAGKEARLRELEPKLLDPNLWNDPAAAKRISQEAAQLKRVTDLFGKLEGDLESLAELYEIASDEERGELDEELSRLQESLDALYRETLFAGEHDDKAAILTLKPGAGGTEAADWAGMLLRMYRRFAERHGFTVELLDLVPSDSAPGGLDYAQLIVRGPKAFGMLRPEGGVHRLVRPSPFDSQHRRQTSFASLEVMPEIDEDIEIEIDPKDLRVDVYRSSGPGGQSVNTTDSAVRVVYKGGTPEEIVVTCQDGKSQIKNREKALTILRARLFEREMERAQAEAREARLVQIGSGERSEKIRTYNFPQSRVTDHRIGFTSHNLAEIMQGQLGELTEALAAADQLRRLEEMGQGGAA